jgi:hypothetical protein
LQAIHNHLDDKESSLSLAVKLEKVIFNYLCASKATEDDIDTLTLSSDLLLLMRLRNLFFRTALINNEKLEFKIINEQF